MSNKAVNDSSGQLASFHAVWFIFFCALCVRLLPLFWATECYDIGLYRFQALPIVKGYNPYLYFTDPEFTNVSQPFVYFPLSMFFSAPFLWLESVCDVPFAILMRLPAIVLDLLLLGALISALRAEKNPHAHLIGWIYAWSPVAVLVSSFQGNMMAGPVLLSFLSYVFFVRDKRLSALLLGFAIAWRTYPVLMLPLFLIKCRSIREAFRYFLHALFPVFIVALPFLAVSPQELIQSLAYSGMSGPMGWHRLISLDPQTAFRWGAFATGAAWICWVLWGARKRGLLQGIIGIYFIFYFFSCQVSLQYWLWAFPFIALYSRWAGLAYSVVIGGLMIVQYASRFPEIIFGSLLESRSNWRLPEEVWSAVSSWALILFLIFMAAAIFLKKDKSCPVSAPRKGEAVAKGFTTVLLVWLIVQVVLELVFLHRIESTQELAPDQLLSVSTAYQSRGEKLRLKGAIPLAKATARADGGFLWKDGNDASIRVLDVHAYELGRALPHHPQKTAPIECFQFMSVRSGQAEAILCSEPRQGVLAEFDLEGNWLRDVAGGALKAPAHLAAGKAGEIFVTDLAELCVYRIQVDGRIERVFDIPYPGNPFPMDRYVLLAGKDNEPCLFDGAQNNIIMKRGRTPWKSLPGPIRGAVDGSGRFYVAFPDEGRVRVVEPDLKRTSLRIFPVDRSGPLVGILSDLFSDWDGRVWGADVWKSRLFRIAEN